MGLAQRLRRETATAASYLYIVAGVLSAVTLLIALWGAFHTGNFFLSIGVVIVGALTVALIWISLSLVVPFYTYMEIRALEKLD